MKKIIKTSLVAVLVIAPMVASAALPNNVTYSNGQTTKPSITADTKVATTTYVQGAYDAAIDAVSAENTRATTVEGDIADLTGFGENAPTNLVAAINAAKAAADAADSGSNSKLGTITGTHNYVVSTNTVSDNLVALDTAVKTNENHIGDLSTLDGSFTTAQKASATTAIAAVDGRVDTLETKVGTLETTMGETALSGFTATTVKGALNELKTAQTTTGATIGTKADGSYINDTNTVAQDLSALDTAVKTNADAITSIEAATLRVYDTWGGDHSQTVNLFTTTSGQGNSVTAPAATIHTSGQQQQPAQVSCEASEFYNNGHCYSCGSGATSAGGQATTCTCGTGTWALVNDQDPTLGGACQ